VVVAASVITAVVPEKAVPAVSVIGTNTPSTSIKDSPRRLCPTPWKDEGARPAVEAAVNRVCTCVIAPEDAAKIRAKIKVLNIMLFGSL
jgi:hypothetical protein